MPRHFARVLLLGSLLTAACRAPLESDLTADQPGTPPSEPLLPLRIGSLGADFARAVATDPAGNAYVASYFAGSVDFDAGSGATVRSASGPYDIAVTSYAADGAFRWTYVIGGSGADVPYNIKRAVDGALYVTGYITAGAICNGHVLPNGGDRDILLMRISAAGTCDWAIAIGSSGDDEGRDLVLDSNGDVVIVGQFSGTVDFDPGPGNVSLVSRGGSDGFVARYGADGTFRAVAQFGGPGDDVANAIAIRADRDLIVGGAFSSTATFGSALAPQQLVSAGALDFFVARLAPSLGLQWAVRGGGGGNDLIGTNGIIAASSGQIFVAGTFTGAATLGAGATVLVSRGDADVFIANIDATGTWAGFARTFGGSGTDGVSSFAADASGNFYLAGSFQGSVDFDPGTGVRVINAMSSAGAADGYVLSLNATGDLRWVNPISAAVSGDTRFAIANGLALSADGSIWSVGRFFGSVDFDPGSGNVSRQSVGDADQFIVRYDQGTGAIRR